MAARIHSVNVSDGGVPELSIAAAVIHADGLSGDRQTDRKHHGGPDKAVCIYSLEVIEAFQAEGHPIEAGSTGENLTIAGLDWRLVVPGSRLRVGDVELEVTYPAVPCKKNTRWFTDGDIRRMDYDRHPGRTRMYTRVLRGGTVRKGDPVQLIAA